MFVCCEGCLLFPVETSATGRSLVQRSPAEFYCVTVCDHMQQ